MIKLGAFQLPEPALILAPMAGISDVPFRELCLEHGADLAVAEMLGCDTGHWHSRKNRDRLRRSNGNGPEIVQIAGADPVMMAEAARLNVATGADVIDINMGCPAKKVLQRAAGSALLKDPVQVEAILRAVTGAVDVPVTLKIRTGWSRDNRNGVDIARLAEDCGIRMLSVHGRTRECRFRGEAEYDTIAAIREAVRIPVIANGDIDSPEKAAFVLRHTGAAGLMLGRSAQGRPWLFRRIRQHLESGSSGVEPDGVTATRIAMDHIRRVHAFYGDHKALLFARKHLSWYANVLPGGYDLKSVFNRLESTTEQTALLARHHQSLLEDVQGAVACPKEKAA
ncbi:MAG: tRNA dihydrouridine synthase DusB [Pseudohongiellaceae bacterium]